MTVKELELSAREIWGDSTIILEQLPALMGVVYGDICRQARAKSEGKPIDEAELQKELGNLIYSTVRWSSELGFSVEDCIRLAIDAQRVYVKA